jgi:hypothetical protein
MLPPLNMCEEFVAIEWIPAPAHGPFRHFFFLLVDYELYAAFIFYSYCPFGHVSPPM